MISRRVGVSYDGIRYVHMTLLLLRRVTLTQSLYILQPQNMASWVQSRGRARRKRSTFVLLYDVEEDKAMGNVEKWRQLEERMVAESQMRVARFQEEGGGKGKNGEASVGEDGREEVGDWDEELRSEETGYVLTYFLRYFVSSDDMR